MQTAVKAVLKKSQRPKRSNWNSTEKVQLASKPLLLIQTPSYTSRFSSPPLKCSPAIASPHNYVTAVPRAASPHRGDKAEGQGRAAVYFTTRKRGKVKQLAAKVAVPLTAETSITKLCRF